MSGDTQERGSANGELPFVAPCRHLGWHAPLRWLVAGWRDYRRASALSVFYGVATALVSVVVSWLAWSFGRFALLALLLSGFVFVAPLLAVGMYSVSRDIELGMRPALARSFALVFRVLGQAGVLALVLLVVLLVWSRAGMVLYALIPVQEGDRGALLELLAVGSVVGAFFAAFTFSVVAFSLPMIADRGVDMITACLSSIQVVLRNKGAALVWGLAIVLLTVAGALLAGVGLIVTMPWLAYATWHGYRESIDASAWPEV